MSDAYEKLGKKSARKKAVKRKVAPLRSVVRFTNRNAVPAFFYIGPYFYEISPFGVVEVIEPAIIQHLVEYSPWIVPSSVYVETENCSQYGLDFLDVKPKVKTQVANGGTAPRWEDGSLVNPPLPPVNPSGKPVPSECLNNYKLEMDRPIRKGITLVDPQFLIELLIMCGAVLVTFFLMTLMI